MPIPAARTLVLDRFLEPAVADAWLAHAIAVQSNYQPSGLAKSGYLDRSYRQSARLRGGLDPFETPFAEAIHACAGDLFAATGVPAFAGARLETELVVHRDGGFYRVHIDTRTDDERAKERSDRLVSAVFYLNREPKRFDGGELAIHAFDGSGIAQRIAPAHNRLVAFASFVPHEVLPVHLEGDSFADARFAVNCWIRRPRP